MQQSPWHNAGVTWVDNIAGVGGRGAGRGGEHCGGVYALVWCLSSGFPWQVHEQSHLFPISCALQAAVGTGAAGGRTRPRSGMKVPVSKGCIRGPWGGPWGSCGRGRLLLRPGVGARDRPCWGKGGAGQIDPNNKGFERNAKSTELLPLAPSQAVQQSLRRSFMVSSSCPVAQSIVCGRGRAAMLGVPEPASQKSMGRAIGH